VGAMTAALLRHCYCVIASRLRHCSSPPLSV
jgi:hypothetical protein